MDAGDEKIYLRVARELSVGVRDEALWTKAFALEGGEEAKTKAHYIRLRVEQIQHQQSVAPEQKASEPAGQTLESSPLEPDRDVLDSELLRVALGNNSAYYLDQHQQMKSSGKSTSWNWAAFLLNIPWALYRKLWMQGLVGLIVCSLISGVFRFIPAFELVLMLVFSATFGMYGNRWVIDKATKLAQSEDYPGRERQELFGVVAKRGGTSLMPLAVVFGLLVVGILAGQSLVSYSQYKESRSAKQPALELKSEDFPPAQNTNSAVDPFSASANGKDNKPGPFDDLPSDQVVEMRNAGVSGVQSEADVRQWAFNALSQAIGRSQGSDISMAMGALDLWQAKYVANLGYAPNYALFNAAQVQHIFISRDRSICFPSQDGVARIDNKVQLFIQCYPLSGR